MVGSKLAPVLVPIASPTTWRSPLTKHADGRRSLSKEMEERMKLVWSKPVVTLTAVGMEVTSYAPAELEDEIVI